MVRLDAGSRLALLVTRALALLPVVKSKACPPATPAVKAAPPWRGPLWPPAPSLALFWALYQLTRPAGLAVPLTEMPPPLPLMTLRARALVPPTVLPLVLLMVTPLLALATAAVPVLSVP